MCAPRKRGDKWFAVGKSGKVYGNPEGYATKAGAQRISRRTARERSAGWAAWAEKKEKEKKSRVARRRKTGRR